MDSVVKKGVGGGVLAAGVLAAAVSAFAGGAITPTPKTSVSSECAAIVKTSDVGLSAGSSICSMGNGA